MHTRNIVVQKFSHISLVFYVLVIFLSFDQSSSVQAKRRPKLTNSSVNKDSIIYNSLYQLSAQFMLTSKNDTENFVFSPLSLHRSLDMLLLGVNSQSEADKDLLEILYPNSSNHINEQAHRFYAKLSRRFREMTAFGLRKHRQLDELESQNRLSDSYCGPKPPIINLWTMNLAGSGVNIDQSYVNKLSRYYNSTIAICPKGLSQKDAQEHADNINAIVRETGFDKNVVDSQDIYKLDTKRSLTIVSLAQVRAFWKQPLDESKGSLFHNYGRRDRLLKKHTILAGNDLNAKYIRFTTKRRRKGQRSASKKNSVTSRLDALEFRAFKYPLAGGLSFTVFEPLRHEDGNELADLEQRLLSPSMDQVGGVDGVRLSASPNASSLLNEALGSLDSVEAHKINLKMPAFSIDNSLEFSKALRLIGVRGIFNGGRTGISNSIEDNKASVVLEAIKQTSSIGVCKGGLTAASLPYTGAPVTPANLAEGYPVRVKYPFIFLVRYKKLPLLMGHLIHL